MENTMTEFELNKSDFIRGWEACMDDNVSIPPQQYWYEQGVEHAYNSIDAETNEDPSEVFKKLYC